MRYRQMGRVAGLMVVVLGCTTLAYGGLPVDWKKRENDSTDTARKRVNDLHKDVKVNKWNFNVGHTTVVEHNDRFKLDTFLSDRHYVIVRNVEEVNERAVRLLRYDHEVREAFIKEHPKVIPVIKHAGPAATSFDWAKLVKDPETHHPLSKESWANAAIEALEWSYLISNGKPVQASAQLLIDEIPDKERAQPSIGLALDALLRHGTVAEDAYKKGEKAKPNATYPLRLVAWGYVPDSGNVEALKKALVQHGPLVVSMNATRHFEAYTSGVYDEKAKGKDGQANHYVLLVGWDDKEGGKGAWRIRNSWGNEWGENGFGWVPFGANQIGQQAAWVKAASTFYKLPPDYYKALGSAK